MIVYLCSPSFVLCRPLLLNLAKSFIKKTLSITNISGDRRRLCITEKAQFDVCDVVLNTWTYTKAEEQEIVNKEDEQMQTKILLQRE